MFRHCVLALLLLSVLFVASAPAQNVYAAAAAQPDKPADKPTEKAVDRAADKPVGKADGQGAQTDDQQKATVDVDPLEAVWAGQRSMLNDANAKAAELKKKFTEVTAGLEEKIKPYEENSRRWMVLRNTLKNWPYPLEAISWRITSTINEVNLSLESVVQARAEVQALLNRVHQTHDSLPEEMRKGRMGKEMQDYVRDVGQARTRLTAVLAQYDAALAPSRAMLKRLQEIQDDISAQLPILWTSYYLQSPVSWLSLDTWEMAVRSTEAYLIPSLQLHQPVDMPVTPAQWGTLGLRFLVCFAFTSLLIVLLGRRHLDTQSPPVVRHIFRVSLPCFCLGFSLIAGAMSASGEFLRMPLALGNLTIMSGLIFLAWDLRLLQRPQEKPVGAPFWWMMPLAFCAYTIIFLPLAKAFALLVWTVLLVISLCMLRRRTVKRFDALQMENGVMDLEPIILWCCLALSLAGLHIYSMGLYLLFVSCSLSFQICLGGLSLVSRLNESLPKEGARSVVAHLFIALAAPVVLAAAILCVLLWIGTMTGGLDMMRHYGFQGMNVAGTQFNIIQVLLILSAFYITRSAVDMGSRFLSHLPKQPGLQIDATLIPSMQTTFTYALWCIFGLFALRSLGMELSSLAMVAGGLSVGIGFGMQNIVNNFISGLILIFSRTLQAGDVVEVGGTTGHVRKISVRATMVETYDNALIYVPNSEFVSSRLINWTRNSRSVRREIKIGVAYGSNVDRVTQLLLAIANKHTNVLKYPAPNVVFSDFGSSTLDFALRIWVRDFDVGVSTTSDIRLEIEEKFRLNHIEIAFPQMDVHIRNMPPRIASRRPSDSRQSRAKYSLRKKRNIIQTKEHV